MSAKSARNICSVPLDWTLADYERHTCGDGSHVHLSHSEVASHQKRNVVIFLRESASRRERAVVQVHQLAVRDDRWAGRQLSTYAMAGEPMNKGLSFKLGEYLAEHVRQNHSWATVMFSQINRPRAQREMTEEEMAAEEKLESVDRRAYFREGAICSQSPSY